MAIDLAELDYSSGPGNVLVPREAVVTLVACARTLRTIAISGDLGGTWCADEAQRASAGVIDTKEEA